MPDKNLFHEAKEQFREKNFEQAIALLQQAIKLNENKAEYHCFLGSCYWYKSDFPNAEESFKTACSFDPENPLLHIKLAKIQLISNKEADALQSLNLASSIGMQTGSFEENEEFWDVFLLRSAIYENQRNYLKAVEEYDRFSLVSGSKDIAEREIKRWMMLIC